MGVPNRLQKLKRHAPPSWVCLLKHSANKLRSNQSCITGVAMFKIKTITKTALAIATLLGGAQAFAYAVLGNTPGSTLIYDDVLYGSTGVTATQAIFSYAGGPWNVAIKLTDLVQPGKGALAGMLVDDINGGYFKLEQGYATTMTTSSGAVITVNKWIGTGTSVIFDKQLLTEGNYISTKLTTAGLYRLSFVYNTANCINVSGNIADFKISTVPVPGSALFFASSLIGAGLWRRRMGSAAS
jgi:hypothetical protein